MTSYPGLIIVLCYIRYIIQKIVFQAVLTTDGARSFVLFAYSLLPKAKGQASSYFAQVCEAMFGYSEALSICYTYK